MLDQYNCQYCVGNEEPINAETNTDTRARTLTHIDNRRQSNIHTHTHTISCQCSAALHWRSSLFVPFVVSVLCENNRKHKHAPAPPHSRLPFIHTCKHGCGMCRMRMHLCISLLLPATSTLLNGKRGPLRGPENKSPNILLRIISYVTFIHTHTYTHAHNRRKWFRMCRTLR